VISSGNDWMGGAGTMQAAVVAAPAVSVQPVDGGQGSFADAMQATLPPVTAEVASNDPPVQASGPIANAPEQASAEAAKNSCSKDAEASVQTMDDGQAVYAAQKANVAKLAHHSIAVKMPGDVQTKIKAAVAKPTKHIETKTAQAAATDASVDVKRSAGGVETVQSAAPVAVTTQAATIALADKGTDAGNAGAGAAVAGSAVVASTSVVAESALADAATGVAVAQAADAAVVKVAVQGSIAETSATGSGVGTQISAVQVQGAGLLPVNAANVNSGNSATHGGAAGLMNASHAGHGSEASELTLHSYDAATPNQLEVGLQGGAFGWLKVRAEMGQNGEVNAYLRGSSVNSTELLQAQAPGIAAYLGAQEVAVRSVQVEAVQSSHSAGGAGVASDGSSGGAASQQEQREGLDSGYDGALEVSATQSNDEWMGGGVLPPQMYAGQSSVTLTGTGGWVNIQA